jgi:hypothetical protein
LYESAGKVPAALSPVKNPFDAGSLAVVARKSNSRFFTDCYHQAAVIEPPEGRKSGRLPSVEPDQATFGTLTISAAFLPEI